MIYHPPVLYLGLVSLVVPFALTTERVVEKRIDLEWATTVRRALLVSWTLLTLGMLFGANWAYVELGWGGFWAWDPVENTALMPWLAITVFLHTSVLQRRDGRATRFNVFLALFAFALSVAGVYLTRSGVTGSIHAFAENPVIGRILLTSALVTAIWSVSANVMSPRGVRWERVDIARDSWLAASGVLVSAVLVFVVAGTVYPAFAQVFLGQSLSIDSTYFVTTVGPVTVLIVLALGLSLRTRWDAAGISMRALIVYLLGVSSLVLIVGLVASQGTVLAAVLVGSASVAGLFLLRDLIVRRPMRRLAPYLAHLGLATVVLASAGSAFGSDFSGSMSSGDVVEVGPKTVRLLGIETGEADRYQYVRARFEIGLEDVAEPEIRAYEEQATPVAEPVLLSSPLSDTIVAISRVTQDLESVDVTVFVKPLVWWVWWGALLVAIAGVVALAGRSGGVAGQRQLATEAPQREETTTGTSSP